MSSTSTTAGNADAIEEQGDQPSLPAPARLMETVVQAMAAKAVYAAAELELPDLLTEGAQTSGELAERTGTHGPSLRRLLLALAGLGVVAQVDTDRFELASLGQPLRKDAPDSLRSMVTMLCGPEVWQSWGELVPSVQTGEPGWNLAHGLTWLEYYARNPEPSTTFNLAMAERTRDAGPGIITAIDVSRFRRVVDVGGGDGTLMAQVLQTQPDVEGVVFDVPAGLDAASTTLAAAGVASRCSVVTGDFFVSVPAEADAYLLKQVIHDWDDERAIAILRNIRTAAPDGRVLLVERTLPESVSADEANARVQLLDLLMLVVTGGRERTRSEFERLLVAAGFEVPRISGLIPPFGYRVIEATPA